MVIGQRSIGENRGGLSNPQDRGLNRAVERRVGTGRQFCDGNVRNTGMWNKMERQRTVKLDGDDGVVGGE